MITVGGKGFDGVIGKFSTTCVQSINWSFTSCTDEACTGEGAVEWGSVNPDLSVDGNTLILHVDSWEGKEGEFRCITCNLSYKVYENEESETTTDCSQNVVIKQLSKNFNPSTSGEDDPPEPEELECYRGTDNGTDYFKNGKTQSHPILLAGYIGDWEDDSIYVEHGLQYSMTGGDTDWHQLDSEGFKPASWVKVYIGEERGCCGNNYIRIDAVEEFNPTGTELQRKVTFWFKATVYPADGLVPECAAEDCNGPAGKPLCKKWEYEIKQCANGYYWCGDHSYTAVPIPCDQDCDEKVDTSKTCRG